MAWRHRARAGGATTDSHEATSGVAGASAHGSGGSPAPEWGLHPEDEHTAGATSVGRTRHRRWPWAIVAVLALVALSFVIRVPYVIMSPGPAINTLGNDAKGTPLIAVGRHATYPTTGSLDFTTVTVRGGPGYTPVTLFDLVEAYVTPHHEILPSDEVFPPNASQEEVKAESTAQMQSSQESATVVALRALGIPVPEKVLVAAVPKGSPALGRLHADDLVVAIDETRVSTSTEARNAIRGHKAGDVVHVGVVRAGKPLDVPVTTTSHDGVTALGVYLRPKFQFPVDITISAGDVGGPSAGTMFALGIYDKLTPGALTGGHRIAGTGALDPNGTVEPIGGIAEKMVAARRAGAEWFLAPKSNCNEVVGHVPDGLGVVAIGSFADAVAAAKGIGTGATSGLPTCH